MLRTETTTTKTTYFLRMLAVLMAVAVAATALTMGFAGDAEAQKRTQPNVVQCPTGGSSVDECVGTNARDLLVGRDSTYDNIKGREGNDIYNGKGGCDALTDTSLTSNDIYRVSVKDFCNVGVSALSIKDNGGRKDILDLSRFYKSTDFTPSKVNDSLHLDGPGVNDIDVLNFYEPNGAGLLADSIDAFKFSDKTLTAQQVADMIA